MKLVVKLIFQLLGGLLGVIFHLCLGAAIFAALGRDASVGATLWVGPDDGFPWATLIINMLGGFLIGLFFGATRSVTTSRVEALPNILLGFAWLLCNVAIFGGDIFTMWWSGHWMTAGVYSVVNLAGVVSSGWLAWYLVEGRKQRRLGNIW